MDPNANVQEQERILEGTQSDQRANSARLLDLRQALYDWLRDGGFEPDWSAVPRARGFYGH